MKFILIALFVLFPSSEAAYKVPVNGVGTNQIKDGAVTSAKLASLNYAISASSGSASTTSGIYVDVPNLNVTLNSTGRPILIAVVPDGANVSPGTAGFSVVGAGSPSEVDVTGNAFYRIRRNGVVIAESSIGGAGRSTTAGAFAVRATNSIFTLFDTPSAGSYTYEVEYYATGSAGTLSAILNYAKLVAIEL